MGTYPVEKSLDAARACGDYHSAVPGRALQECAGHSFLLSRQPQAIAPENQGARHDRAPAWLSYASALQEEDDRNDQSNYKKNPGNA